MSATARGPSSVPALLVSPSPPGPGGSPLQAALRGFWVFWLLLSSALGRHVGGSREKGPAMEGIFFSVLQLPGAALAAGVPPRSTTYAGRTFCGSSCSQVTLDACSPTSSSCLLSRVSPGEAAASCFELVSGLSNYPGVGALLLPSLESLILAYTVPL